MNTTMGFEPSYFIYLEFECIRDITNLPFFPGLHWGGLIWNLCREYGFTGARTSSLRVIPVQNGMSHYFRGDTVGVNLAFQESEKEEIRKIIGLIIKGDGQGIQHRRFDHFDLEYSLRFRRCRCLVSGSETEWLPLSTNALTPEIKAFQDIEEPWLLFYTPLRLNRPVGCKVKASRHRLFDFNWFSIPYFITRIADLVGEKSYDPMKSMIMTGEMSFIWVDIPHKASLGGVLGCVRIQGDLTEQERELLVLGQYLGIGKNTSFGQGCYQISGLHHDHWIHSCQNRTDLLGRAIREDKLKLTMEEMKDTTPGPDGITYGDIVGRTGDFIRDTITQLETKTYLPGSVLQIERKKPDGTIRSLEIQNFKDHLICKAITTVLAEAVDPILESSAFGYRQKHSVYHAVRTIQGLQRQGYVYGFKADINHFFDSIRPVLLQKLLEALFHHDPMISIISKFIEGRSNGIPQGNPFSPVLSNIYLSCFDHEVRLMDGELVRYGDDFVALTAHPEVDFMENVTRILDRLGLQLNRDKVIQISESTAFEFLGYHIEGEMIVKIEKKIDVPDSKWNPALLNSHIKGLPVYISFFHSSVRSECDDLVMSPRSSKEKYLGQK